MRRCTAILSCLLVALTLSACVVAPARPGRAWAPGHYNAYGAWVPGHWR